MAAASLSAFGRPGVAHAIMRGSPGQSPFLGSEPRPDIRRVIVIGGGIAGLSAAYLLSKSGVEVEVLEAGPELGGRMSSQSIPNPNGIGTVTLDSAAQVVSNSYEVIPSLLEEMGLSSRLLPIAMDVAVVRDGGLKAFSFTNPASPLTSGLLRWNELPSPRALAALPALGEALCVQAGKNVTGWAKMDESGTQAWAESKFGAAMTNFVLDPFLSALYFKDLEDVSQATLMSVVASAFPNKKAYVIQGGIGSLCRSLGEKIPHRLGCAVSRVAQSSDGRGVVVESAQGAIRADAAILAIPAPAAARIYSPADSAESAILGTQYMPSITLCVQTSARWNRSTILPKLSSYYVSRQERGLIYMAFTNTGNVFSESERSSDSGMIKFILSGEAIKELWAASDIEILERVAREAEPYLPGLKGAAELVTSSRFENGMPDPGAGRFRRIRDYRASVPSVHRSDSKKILLAGDYTSTITTDGAAESGVWAARRLLG